MGNILTTTISYDKTDVYVFKDTNGIILTIHEIVFLEVDNEVKTAGPNWVTTSSIVSPLNDFKYDVTLQYQENGVPADLTLNAYSSTITNNHLVASFKPLSFILNSDKIRVKPSKNDSFTVTIVDTNTLFINTSAFDNAIFSIKNTETEVYGYVRDKDNDDVAITRNVNNIATSKNFDTLNRVPIVSIGLPKGRWLITASGTFDFSSTLSDVFLWFDIGELSDEYRRTLRAFNNVSTNTNISMQCEFFFEDSVRVYWCITTENSTTLTSSFFNTIIPFDGTVPSNSFFNEAITNGECNNNAKISAISVSDN